MSSTPRTDDEAYTDYYNDGQSQQVVPAELAQTMERELTSLRAQLAEVSSALQVIVDNGGIGPEDMFHDARAALKRLR